MTRIEGLADEIIKLSEQLEKLEQLVQSKRDAMFGLLATQPAEAYEFGEYRFKKSKPSIYVTFPKQKFIEALTNAGLPDDVRSRIIGDSMNESERAPHLVMSKLNKPQ